MKHILGFVVGLLGATAVITSARASQTDISGFLKAASIGSDTAAQWIVAPSISCPTLSGTLTVAGVCLKYAPGIGGSYLGWTAQHGSVGTSVMVEMPPGAGPTDAWWTHITQAAGSGGTFLSEFDLNNFANDGVTHNRAGLVVRGLGEVSNAAIKVTDQNPGNDQWVNGLYGSAQVFGPTFSDTSNSLNAIDLAAGSHYSLLTHSSSASFTNGLFEGQADAPAGSSEDILWEAPATAGSGNWSIGPQTQAGTPCSFCVETPSASGATQSFVTFSSDGSTATDGTRGWKTSAGSVHDVDFDGSGTGSVALQADWTDVQDLSSGGIATIVGSMVCGDAGGDLAQWQITAAWNPATESYITQNVKLLTWDRRHAGSASAALFWVASFSGTVPHGSVPQMTVVAPASLGKISCKADDQLFVIHPT